VSVVLAQLDTLDLGWFVAALFAAIYVLEMAVFVKARRRLYMEGFMRGYDKAAANAKEAESYRTIDFAGVKVARELAPLIIEEADGAHVLTRAGKRLKLARHDDSFLVTEDRG
jgi:hypothetical protein